MSRKPRLTLLKIEEAIRASGGIKTIAAHMLNISRSTLYRHLAKHPRLADVCDEVESELCDLAEAEIIKAIRAGDMPTVRWYLETKGRDRGYSRRVENTGPNGGAMQVVKKTPDLSDYSEEELEIMLRAAERRERQAATVSEKKPTELHYAGNAACHCGQCNTASRRRKVAA